MITSTQYLCQNDLKYSKFPSGPNVKGGQNGYNFKIVLFVKLHKMVKISKRSKWPKWPEMVKILGSLR